MSTNSTHKSRTPSDAPVGSASTDAASVANKRLLPLFPILLVVIGTLPLGVGIGTVCRQATAENLSQENQVHDLSPTGQISANAVQKDRQKADNLFRAGDFELALQLYQSKENAQSLRPTDDVFFKIAICHEALRQWDEALAVNRVLSSRDQSAYRAAALLAQVRIGISRGDFQQARAVSAELFQLAAESHQVPDTTLTEARFLSAMAGLLEDSQADSSREGVQPIPPTHALVWPGREAFEVDRHVVPPSSETPVTGPMHETPPTAESVSTKAQSSPLLERHAQESTVAERRQIAEGDLEHLIKRDPKHWLVPHAKLALGHSDFRRGNLVAAAARYDQLIDKSSSALSMIGAFNRGVMQYRLRNYAAASVAFERIIDGAPGQELCVPALILRGRALLELGDGEHAAFDEKRAADLCGRPEEVAWATVFMGMSYLQQNRPQLAAQAMFLRRDRLEQSSARIAAAFLVSLARYESLESAESRDREALFLMRVLHTGSRRRLVGKVRYRSDRPSVSASGTHRADG